METKPQLTIPSTFPI